MGLEFASKNPVEPLGSPKTNADLVMPADEASRFAVPLRTNKYMNCGPVAIEMAAEYFGISFEPKQIRDWASPYGDGATMTIGLAVAAAELGMRVRYFTKSLELDPSYFESRFYQQGFASFEEEKEKGDRQIARCRELGGIIEERVVPLNEILTRLSSDCVVVALLDWTKITGRFTDYWGHFVPVVGFDSNAVFVNHSGIIKTDGEIIEQPTAGMKIDRELFERSRLATGTDADVLFLERSRI